MNTLAELIDYHKMRAHNERQTLAYAVLRQYQGTAADCRKAIERHLAAVATLERAVADIERLQK